MNSLQKASVLVSTIKKLREIIVDLEDADLLFEAAQLSSSLEMIDAHTREVDTASPYGR